MSHTSPVYIRCFQLTKTHLSISRIPPHPPPNFFETFLQTIRKKLQIPKTLKRLTLDLKTAQLNQQDLKQISQHLLKKLHNIENLKIILSPDPLFQDQYFELLLKSLRTFRGLKTIEVALPKRLEETSQKHKISDFLKALRRSAPKLQEAKFTFIDDMSWGIHAESLPILQKWRLNRLSNLQNLSLHLPTSVFLSQGKLDLSALKSLQRLKSLNIALVDHPGDAPDVPSKEAAFDPSKIFPHLKRFTWAVKYNCLSNRSELEILGPEIAKRLKGLEDFGMRFQQDGELMNQDIMGTTQCLNSLQTDLSRFSLKIHHGKLSSSDSKAFIEALAGPRLKDIHTLCLEFGNCKGINNRFLEKLGQIIGQNMKGLRFLRLSFEKYKSTKNSFTNALMAALGLKGVSDKGISKLGGMISEGCQNLELVSLEFLGYRQISDRGVMSSCEGFRKIQSLKKVQLRFKSCPKVTTNRLVGPQKDARFIFMSG